MSFTTFIISTGRCGTQWLSNMLASNYPDDINVAHEPLHNQYEARKILASAFSLDSPLKCSQVVATHLDKIDRLLSSSAYIECGHPNWSTLPVFAQRFNHRVRFVHLYRHPVPTACSWLTHFAYQPPLLPHLAEKILLSPTDAGVQFPEFQSIWHTLSPFQKCLYYWTEVNAFALKCQSQFEAPWLSLSYESLFYADGLADLLEFLQLPARESHAQQKLEIADQFRYVLNSEVDLSTQSMQPQTHGVAKRLGYDLEDFNLQALRQRYWPSG